MNIYKKLITARVELQDMKLKKSGKNQNIVYYELGDFLPAIVKLCERYELLTRFNIIYDTTEKAILTIINASEPQEKVEFVVPTAEVELPRGQKIQNLGAKITYLRRYMLMTAFEIVESDLVDSINREMTEEVAESDLKLVSGVKTVDELGKIYKTLEKNYTSKVLLPHFAKRKQEILDEQEANQEKKVVKKGAKQ